MMEFAVWRLKFGLAPCGVPVAGVEAEIANLGSTTAHELPAELAT